MKLYLGLLWDVILAVIYGNIAMALGYAVSLAIWLRMVDAKSAQPYAFWTGMVLGALALGFQTYRGVRSFRKSRS